MIFLLFALSAFFSACTLEETQSSHLSKSIIKHIYPAIVEVVVPKREDQHISYARPLPFDQQDFHIRNDKYHPIGTAFFISRKRLASAAHVFGIDSFTFWKDHYVRNASGEVHKVGKIVKFSQYRDYIEFELESYPQNFNILSLSDEVEIGDRVYAVGNAQGEGISTRGGQVSSFTPEHVSGSWKYIRFSSPASPGNSGGPLVNSRGETVGVVVMKSQAENLNYALPVQEFQNLSESSAEFFIRGLKIQDGTQVVSEDWKESAPLPGTLESLREKAIPSKSDFYRVLVKKFKTTYADTVFPVHPRFREYLRSQNSPLYIGEIDKDTNLNQWSVSPVELKKMAIAAQQAIYYGEGSIFSYGVVIETPPQKNLLEQIQDEENLVKTLLIGLGANRTMAGQRIPILGYGKAQETSQWRDRLGRPWSSYLWHILYNNTFVAVHATSLPSGVLCLVDIHWARVKNEGYMDLVKENVHELTLSYSGNPKQWSEFLALPKVWLPTYFEKIKLEYSAKKVLKIEDNKYSTQVPNLKLDDDSTVTARMGYDIGKNLAPKILAWEIHEKKIHQTGVTIAQFYEPSEFSNDLHRQTWNEILRQKGVFNGKIQNSDGVYSLRKVLKPRFQTEFWDSQKIDSIFVASCFSELDRGRNWPQRTCSHIQRRFKLK